ncbi:MAG: hypothetical protein ACK5R2_04690 [Cyanobacteriota bacterium]
MSFRVFCKGSEITGHYRPLQAIADHYRPFSGRLSQCVTVSAMAVTSETIGFAPGTQAPQTSHPCFENHFTGKARLREIKHQDDVRPEVIEEGLMFMDEFSEDLAALARL